MTKEQITYLRNTYGDDKLTMVIFGDGKRVTVTKEMIDDNEISFDDGNELVTFIEKHAIFSDLMCYRNRSTTSIFEYASIIGLIFVQNEDDMYYDGENGEGKVFMTRDTYSGAVDDIEVKLR